MAKNICVWRCLVVANCVWFATNSHNKPLLATYQCVLKKPLVAISDPTFLLDTRQTQSGTFERTGAFTCGYLCLIVAPAMCLEKFICGCFRPIVLIWRISNLHRRFWTHLCVCMWLLVFNHSPIDVLEKFTCGCSTIAVPTYSLDTFQIHIDTMERKCVSTCSSLCLFRYS